jgi:hypothetical protein
MKAGLNVVRAGEVATVVGVITGRTATGAAFTGAGAVCSTGRGANVCSVMKFGTLVPPGSVGHDVSPEVERGPYRD